MGRTMHRIEWEDYMPILEDLRKKKRYKLLLLWALGGHTAYRNSEIRTMTWGDIMDREVINVETSKTARFGAKKARRTVVIGDRLKGIIEECCEHMNPKKQKNLYIFRNTSRSSQGENTPLTKEGMAKMVKYICGEYGLTKQNMGMHSLRKAFAWRVYNFMGADHYALEAVRNLLGHANTNTTCRYIGIHDSMYTEIYKSI